MNYFDLDDGKLGCSGKWLLQRCEELETPKILSLKKMTNLPKLSEVLTETNSKNTIS